MIKKTNLNPSGTPYDNKTPAAAVVEKGWGVEVFMYHDPQEDMMTGMNVQTVKFLHILKDKKLSRHFHLEKREIFAIACGRILLEVWDRNAVCAEITMGVNDRIVIPPGCQHRMTGLDDWNTIVEISTLDKPTDSYRIQKGD